MRQLVLLTLLLISGCASPAYKTASGAAVAEVKPGSGDAQLNRLAEEFTNGYLDWRPQAGTGLGLHQYDGKITDWSKSSVEGEVARLKSFQERFAAINPKSLSPGPKLDWQLLGVTIRGELFKFSTEIEGSPKNPMTYAGALDVNIYIKRDFAPLEHRIRSVIAIEQKAPRLFAAARANLGAILPKPYVETAIDIAKGSADFLKKDLVEALKDVTDKSLLMEFQNANQMAIAELRGFANWLEKERLPKAHQHYALGREKYQEMLAAEGITMPPEKILELGLEELKREQKAFADAAAKIDPKRKPVEVFKAIQKEHPTEQTLISETRKNLDAIRQYVVDKHLVTIPSAVRVKVEETPQYARATSFASMDTPGPFETKATEAYYYVTPVESDWDKKQKEEWLTAFNYYTTDVVSIHEAYPGHYVQFLCLNASKATKAQKVFNSYAFVEGWAHYTEKMMLDEGFGSSTNADSEVKAAKYRLAQSDEALLRLCRLCVSIQTHCEGMTLTNATKFFRDNCYYEPKPASSEALRGTFDPGYLYYTVGKLEILKLREDYKRQEGANYSLVKFHDELLRHGAPPILFLREIMLKDPASWDQIL
ncbi:MAG TPA: DUF885 domain-containing protein [Verrucomicrobiae bacterium]|nr:DUF885 domain-containing protein [Verrucomicrobiae bacterium]